MVLWAIKWKWYGGSSPETSSAGQRSQTNYLTDMPAISGGGDQGEMQGRELHKGQRSHRADEEEAVRETRVAQEGESTGVIRPWPQLQFLPCRMWTTSSKHAPLWCHFSQNQRNQACLLKVLVPVAHSESQGINSKAQELGRSLVLEIREASLLLFTSLNFDAGNTGEKEERELERR